MKFYKLNLTFDEVIKKIDSIIVDLGGYNWGYIQTKKGCYYITIEENNNTFVIELYTNELVSKMCIYKKSNSVMLKQDGETIDILSALGFY